MFRNPNHRATRQQIKQRDQIRVGEMDAAVRRGLAEGFLIRRAMDVNVARVRIHVDVAIQSLVQAGFETFEPQDARGDFGVREFRLRRVADDLARFLRICFAQKVKRFVRRCGR
jgi:hypothetical protein